MKQLYQAYSTDMKYASKHRKKRKKKTKSGVTIPIKIPNDLADFINVEHNSEMTRCELQKILCKTLKDKKLQYEKDKRILRADDELKKIFNLPESVNQVTDAKDKNGFTIFTLQKYISKKLKESNNSSQL
jgi:chromatin remodeling complex protein RSC6